MIPVHHSVSASIRRFKLTPAIVLASFTLAFISGCWNSGDPERRQDTCTQGDNMTNIRAVPDFDAKAVSPELVISWDTGTQRGAELPEAYFEQLVLDQDTDEAVSSLIDNLMHSSGQQITVVFTDLTDYLANENSVSFNLVFPDRGLYIDCTHPGAQDQYLLNIVLSFNDEGDFSGAEFTQFINFGAI